MTKINGCLKCVFIFFNVIYAVLGCVLIYWAIESSVQASTFGAPSMTWTLVFAVSMLGISSLGIYAACSEKVLFLKIFVGCMAAGMVIMLILGIVMAVVRKQVEDNIDGSFLKTEEQRKMVITLQEEFQCCGVIGASDWGKDIPQSCVCNKTDPSVQCIDKPQGTTGPNKVYEQGCKDFIFIIPDLIFRFAMGVLFGFAVTALLGLLISLLMIHQVNQHYRV